MLEIISFQKYVSVWSIIDVLIRAGLYGIYKNKDEVDPKTERDQVSDV